ncbi:MAG: ATP-binding protein [Candidatus Binatia bacterium]|nr:ATP-binding protein [Candidatus Binatia bacterium]
MSNGKQADPQNRWQNNAETNLRETHADEERGAAQPDLTPREAEIERLRAELEETRRAFDHFACAVAHDLRTPLRHIEAFAHLIQKEVPDASAVAQSYLVSLRNAVADMRELLEALLRLCRAGHAPLARRRVDLKQMVLTILARFQRRFPQRVTQVTFRGDLEASADPDLTYLLLHALLDNAWKYAQPRPTTTLEVGERLCGSHRVYYVRDFGVGFPQEQAQELFKPLRRLHSSAEFEGVGLGLALAKRIVERHGGEIWAEGEVGQGACFYFTLGA